MKATKTAAEIAKATGARMELLFVRAPYVLPAELGMSAAVELDRMEQRRGEDILKSAADAAKALGVDVAVRQTNGSPAERIIDAAQEADVDLVAVGSQGKNAITRALLGSVAHRVLHLCSKPVLIVR